MSLDDLSWIGQLAESKLRLREVRLVCLQIAKEVCLEKGIGSEGVLKLAVEYTNFVRYGRTGVDKEQ